MSIIIHCGWCGLKKELPHKGRLGKHNFCNTKCQHAAQRGFEINLDLKQEIFNLKQEGHKVKDIQYILDITKSAYYETLKIKY